MSFRNDVSLEIDIDTMKGFTSLWALFIGVPFLELYLLIKVGGAIGAAWTIVLVGLTAFLGVKLLRSQGFATLRRAQAALDAGALPAMELLDGIALLVGGALLLTPGFLTDAVGFLCLLPHTRKLAIRTLASRVLTQASTAPPPPDRPYTIEGEFRRED